jgi:hypothetical protein
MTIVLNKIYPKLDLRRLIVNRINVLVYTYKRELDIESIYFNTPIDGIKFYKLFPHYTETDFVSDWFSKRISGSTLLKILDCLKNRDFYGYCRTTTNQLVKITPRKKIKNV